jgi:hypothetical protein
MTKQFRPIVVLSHCWLHEELRLSPRVLAEPLQAPLSFEREVDLVLEIANRLGITPAPGFRAAARDKLEGV